MLTIIVVHKAVQRNHDLHVQMYFLSSIIILFYSTPGME